MACNCRLVSSWPGVRMQEAAPGAVQGMGDVLRWCMLHVTRLQVTCGRLHRLPCATLSYREAHNCIDLARRRGCTQVLCTSSPSIGFICAEVLIELKPLQDQQLCGHNHHTDLMCCEVFSKMVSNIPKLLSPRRVYKHDTLGI